MDNGAGAGRLALKVEPMRRRIPWPATLVVLLLARPADGELIADRATLDALLGAAAVHEDFESFDVAPGGTMALLIPFLDAETIVHGQGPGLVQPGARYVTGAGEPGDLLFWQGDGYTGLPTKTLGASQGIDVLGELTIEYERPIMAFGLDLLDFEGLSHVTTVSIFDSVGGLIDSFDLFIDGPVGVFLGYEAPAIGAVSLTGSPGGWSTIIDNHTYGVPTPAALPLLAVAVLARGQRRRGIIR